MKKKPIEVYWAAGEGDSDWEKYLVEHKHKKI